MLLTMLAEGRLHLSGIAKLAPLLTAANREELLARAAGKSKRGIEELVAELSQGPTFHPPSGSYRLARPRLRRRSRPSSVRTE